MTCKWFVRKHGDRFRPLSTVVPCCSPSKWPFFWLIRWGLLTTYDTWDDPPSTSQGTITSHIPYQAMALLSR